MAGKWPPHHAHATAEARQRWLGELNQATRLTLADVIDNGIRNARRRRAVHHQADNARRPAGRVPLHLNEDERVGGEKQWRLDYLATLNGTALTQARRINLKAGLAQEMQRQRVPLRL